jgi:peptidoglycan/xylan/chitin deacetylase (PgdA/CDA1 family)
MDPVEMPVWNEPARVIAPILLYHHIADRPFSSRLFVSPATFQSQLNVLKSNGYASISVAQLAKTLKTGSPLPQRSVVITFDDGNEDVYENAFPIMKEFGYIGTVYIIAGRLKTAGFLNKEQIRELLDAGWEIGSNGMNQIAINYHYTSVWGEVAESRKKLEKTLGVVVETFAYPYGIVDGIIQKVVKDNYKTAVTQGKSIRHILESIYNLSRIEIVGDMDLNTFETILPWKGELS